jgi:uncharacterized protein (DUF2236 family)
MPRPLDPMRLISWASGASLPSALPIHDPDPDPGLMGPDSVTWRLHSEQWLIAAGARAFLMQAAHPVVAQGALDHSRFREDPFGRVFQTVQGMSTLIFGTTAEVNAMARHINQLHLTVRGTLAETVGRHTAGEPYSAMDPPALLWVHVAFVDSVLTAYRSLVGPLSPDECEQYWQESCRYARRLGLTDAMLPPGYSAIQAYIQDAIASGEVAVGSGARIIAQTILRPPLHWARRPLWAVVRLLTVGQLPPAIRVQYGLRWTPLHAAAFGAMRGTFRLLRWLFPHYIGRSIAVRFAMQRMRGELLPRQDATATVRAGPSR